MYAMYQATQYVSQANIEGDLVECGVWKGGSSMIGALTLLQQSDTSRKLYLYDTYAGMPPPEERDTELGIPMFQMGMEALVSFLGSSYGDIFYASLEEVRTNMHSTGYPPDNFVFVEGKVEDTIPGIIPDKISLLRLDSDWYQSTYHELEHLYPRLSNGGVLIIDDYGAFKGSKDAVDQYFREQNITL
ncbi:MAG: hypothetical protein ETSY2_54965, partial [Candidatus Entotheonella gemina]